MNAALTNQGKADPKAAAKGQGAAKANPGPSASSKTGGKLPDVSPVKDYEDYYGKQKDVSEAQISVDVAFLRGLKDWTGIEKALTAYLNHHSKHAAPWMLGQLATSMEINKRDPAAIKQMFGRYALLASKGKDPVSLIAASDALLLHKYYEIEVTEGVGGAGKIRLADLLDQAMKAAPSRPEPILMSLLMAEQTRDARRMGDSAETLLSLGWPGVDGAWRVEIPNRTKGLAKTLKEDGRDDEAKALLERIPIIEARDLVIRLTWTGDARIDLLVDEPLGATADHANPRTVFGGALVREGHGKDRESLYVCPRGFNGEYVVRLDVLYNDPKKPAQVAIIEVITHEGTSDEKVTTHKVSLSKPQPVRINLTGGRRTTVLPYEAPKTIATPRADNAKAKDGIADPKRSAADASATKPKGQ